jgi:hypothetical protein
MVPRCLEWCRPICIVLSTSGFFRATAQSLARHCANRLTMDVYTHIGLHDQRTAIELLPAPPEIRPLANGRAGGSGAKPNGHAKYWACPQAMGPWQNKRIRLC